MLKANRIYNAEQSIHKEKHKKQKKQKKRKALMNFIEGAAIYAFCVTLPALLGVIVRLYESHPIPDRENLLSLKFSSLLSSINAFNKSLKKNITIDTSQANIALNFSHNNGVRLSEKNNDLYLICILAISLAVLRFGIIYCVTSRKKSEMKKDALIRCRSMQMLRSYDLSELNNSSIIRKEQKQQEQTFVYALRYATGLFRFLYTLITSISAFFLFRQADFWPVYLGGKVGSSTANCWDLSGGIALTGVDQDFDQFNSTLRYYFVVQASYQIQSLFFHCFLFILSNTWKLKKSWKDFLRSFSEHIIGLFLLTGSFLFSSWRRLGAVGMFALDASGLFLHLLQIVLNVATTNNSNQRYENTENFMFQMPKDVKYIGQTPKVTIKEQTKGKQIRRNIVWFVHRFLVVPSFM